MVMVYSLLIIDFLPPNNIRILVNRILYLYNRKDLKRYIIDNLDTKDSDLL